MTGALNLARRRQQAGRGLFMAADVTSLSEVRFLTVAEVATIMRVSKMTVYRLVHSGELEAIRVGRSFRVPEQAVNPTQGGLVGTRTLRRGQLGSRRGSRRRPGSGAGMIGRPAMTGRGRCRGTLWRWRVPGRCAAGVRVGMPVKPGRRARVISWAQSSRSAASGWPRRSTANCCGRRAFSAGTRSSDTRAEGAAVPPGLRGAGSEERVILRDRRPAAACRRPGEVAALWEAM